MYLCPAVQHVIHSVTDLFFPDNTVPFGIEDILTAISTDKNDLYNGQDGQKLASTIWDIVQAYIIKCHTIETTPVPATAIFEIKSQLNRILKILPKSRLAIHVEKCPRLQNIIK